MSDYPPGFRHGDGGMITPEHEDHAAWEDWYANLTYTGADGNQYHSTGPAKGCVVGSPAARWRAPQGGERTDGIGFEHGYMRREFEPCERGTVGCCVRHSNSESADSDCECW